MISVIVPVYKVERYLPRCVESILGQTETDLELILVDDGSPDGCPKLCDRYAGQDSRVRVIHQANQGVGAARNAGIAAAEGEYLMFVDSDDWLEPGCLEKLRKALRDGYDYAACDYVESVSLRTSSVRSPKARKTESEESKARKAVSEESKARKTVSEESKAHKVVSEEPVLRMHESVPPRIVHSNLALRELYFERDYGIHRTVWGKLFAAELVKDCMFISILYGEDMVFMMDVLSAASSAVYIGDREYHYLINEAGISEQIRQDKEKTDRICESDLIAGRRLLEFAEGMPERCQREARSRYAWRVYNMVCADIRFGERDTYRSRRTKLLPQVKELLASGPFNRVCRMILQGYAGTPTLLWMAMRTVFRLTGRTV